MGGKMTLEQVRDRLIVFFMYGGIPNLPLHRMRNESRRMAEVIDAHLANPAQAVDVGEIREVIDGLNVYCETSDDSCYGTLSTSLVRDYTGRLTRAIDN